MKNSAPYQASFKPTFSKSSNFWGGYIPSDTALRRAIALALIGADTPFLTSKIWSPHFENCSAVHAQKVNRALSHDLCQVWRYNTLSCYVTSLYAMVKELSKCKTQVEQLENDKTRLTNEVNQLEQYSRRNNVTIFGIPKQPGENTNQL